SACSRKEYISLEDKLRSLNMEENVNRNKLIELVKNVPQEINLYLVWDFKKSKSFLELEKYSYELLSIAIDLFESDELYLSEKQVIAFAIQNVKFDIFKYFFRDLARGFRAGSIDEEIIIWHIFPEEYNYYIIENYKDPIIREALNIVLNSNRVNHDLRYAIQLVLDGTLWREREKRMNPENFLGPLPR
ncbi:MAG: hypothetical protein FWE36_08955, partial [Erysipelotrichales bacterium]|nr:hypothetical protein [Erysipelotrichales bacterium]